MENRIPQIGTWFCFSYSTPIPHHEVWVIQVAGWDYEWQQEETFASVDIDSDREAS